MAKRSATECAGILDVCQRLRLVDESNYMKGRELLIGIVSMLIKMARETALIGQGQGQEHGMNYARALMIVGFFSTSHEMRCLLTSLRRMAMYSSMKRLLNMFQSGKRVFTIFRHMFIVWCRVNIFISATT